MSEVTAAVARDVLNDPEYLSSAELVTRVAGSRTRGGDFAPGAETVTPVQVVAMPVTDRQGGEIRQLLPEGVRVKDMRQFILTEDVRPGVEGQSLGDIIRYKGLDYRAVRVQDWDDFRVVAGVAQETA